MGPDSGGRQRHAHSTARLLEGVAAGGRSRGERPKAISEYLVDRLAVAGASKICFVISPSKADIIQYYGSGIGATEVAFVVQPKALGLCDAIFRARLLIHRDESVLAGLPDTIWFSTDALLELPTGRLAFLTFPVDCPALFDAVITDESGRVREIQVKAAHARSNPIWGAFRVPGRVLHELGDFWKRRRCRNEYIGTLVNAWLEQGGEAVGVNAGAASLRCRRDWEPTSWWDRPPAHAR